MSRYEGYIHLLYHNNHVVVFAFIIFPVLWIYAIKLICRIITWLLYICHICNMCSLQWHTILNVCEEREWWGRDLHFAMFGMGHVYVHICHLDRYLSSYVSLLILNWCTQDVFISRNVLQGSRSTKCWPLFPKHSSLCSTMKVFARGFLETLGM